MSDPRIIDLLQTHVTTALATAPRDSCHAFDLNRLKRPEIDFWAIWDGETAVGIGALMNLGGGNGEVKSMHTAKAARGRGIADAMIRHIVETARARGYHRLSLETGSGDYFAAARALYARHGFSECPPFGAYAPDPHSLFMTIAI
ncbi:MAG TPA: GNAT family N-acetyltransferase [Sphingomonas sp.]|nr:GNAT family N-acetyltransferase [Sphingomonas sp.]